MRRRRRKSKNNPIVLVIFFVGILIALAGLGGFITDEQIVVERPQPTPIPIVTVTDVEERESCGCYWGAAIGGVAGALVGSIFSLAICVRVYRTQVKQVQKRLNAMERQIAYIRRGRRG